MSGNWSPDEQAGVGITVTRQNRRFEVAKAENRRFEVAKAEAGAALLHCVLATQARILKAFCCKLCKCSLKGGRPWARSMAGITQTGTL